MKLLKVPLLLLFFIFLLLLVSGGLFITVALLNSPTGAVQAEGILFQVKKGEVSEHVFIRLEQEQLVRSSLLLRLLSKISNTE
jgi:cell division protein YceG involved in septum cleavage